MTSCRIEERRGKRKYFLSDIKEGELQAAAVYF